MDIFLWIGFYFLTFYAFLPALVSRLFGFRVFMKGKAATEIALTFDDGPDPEYTPKLLDLLKLHGAKATFFVVGHNAERNPDIIARIHAEGHKIGIHNYVHKTNWLMRPKTVKRHIQRTSDVIFDITGERPSYYRPPWGIVNVFDYRRLGHLQIVLWSAMFEDWRKKTGTEKLIRRMKNKLRPGEVFLLHDCGRTLGADRDAPANTIAALEKILVEGGQMGLRFVAIDELISATEKNKSKIGPFKKALVKVWLVYEKLFHVVFRLRPIGDGKSFNYRIRKYSGQTIVLRDNQTLRSGEKVMEIHFDNKMLHELGMNSKNEVQTGIKIIREMEKALPLMAREIIRLPEGEGVKALYGISMIHRGADGLGYQTFALPSGLFSWMTNVYLRILIRVIHPQGNDRVRKSTRMSPHMLVMPREVLLGWADESASFRRKHRLAKSEA